MNPRALIVAIPLAILTWLILVAAVVAVVALVVWLLP